MVYDEYFSPDAVPRPRTGRPWTTTLLALALVVTGYGAYRTVPFRSSTPLVTASSGRITPDEDHGGNLSAVSRRGRPELWYRVILADAPIGTKLSLACDWIGPAGEVEHRNRYKTRAIERPTWPTHARLRLGPSSPTGTWTVRLSLDGRVLHATTFEVRD